VTFLSGTDQTTPLFSLSHENHLFVSNSLILLFVASGEEPDPIYPFYAYDILRIFRDRSRRHGSESMEEPPTRLPTRSGAGVRVHFLSLLVIGGDFLLRVTPVTAGVKPTSYLAYRTLLGDTVKAVLANGACASRRFPYRSMVLISKGYDSTAVATLAAEAGCRTAATILDSRQSDPECDSGAEIAQRLGLSCQQVDRWAYLSRSSPLEAEFAWQSLSPELGIASLESQLPGTILLSGIAGMVAWQEWQTTHREETLHYGRTFTAGISQVEFRLRLGYLLFAVPSIALSHLPALNAISRSQEMDPWRLGGTYDAPIPRRLAEEGGIPRQAFGIRKMSSSQVLLIRPGTRGAEANYRYVQFVRTTHHLVGRDEWLAWRIRHLADRWIWLLLYGGRRWRNFFLRFPWKLSVLPGNRHLIPWSSSFLLQWSFSELRARYKMADKSSAF
jgi:hypothetical protein